MSASINIGIINLAATFSSCLSRVSHPDCRATRLVTWYREGADVQRLLPQLATYLGHVHIGATQHYLTMTPELLRQASLRFERYARGGDDHA